MTLEKRINDVCDWIPFGWMLSIKAETGYATVEVQRPDGTTVDMDDGESDVEEQFRNGAELICQEFLEANNKVSGGRSTSAGLTG